MINTLWQFSFVIAASWFVLLGINDTGLLLAALSLLAAVCYKYLGLSSIVVCGLIIAGICLQLEAPFDDQLLLYNHLKVFDFFSNFSERPLYSAYKIFPENNHFYDKLGKADLYWDYTYLPLSLVPAFFSLTLSIDPRFIYCIIYISACLINIRLSSVQLKPILYVVFFLSPAPLLLGVYWLSNTALVPLAIAIMRVALIQSKNTLLSATLLSISLLINQSMLTFVPFLVLFLLKTKKLNVLVFSGLTASGTLLYFAWNFPQNFLNSAILQHTGLTDLAVFNQNGVFSELTMIGLLQKLSGLPEKYLLELVPRNLIAATFISILIYTFYRNKNANHNSVISYGAIAGLATIFITKICWLDLRYYLAPLLGALVLKPENSNSQELKKTGLITATIITSVILFGATCNIYINRSLNWPNKHSMNFKISDIDSNFSIKDGHGLIKTRSGNQFWILAAPGLYQISDQNSVKTNLSISQERSFGLRISFYINDKNQALLLPNDDVGGLYNNYEFIVLENYINIVKIE